MRYLNLILSIIGWTAVCTLSAQTTTILEHFTEFECTSATSATLTEHYAIRIDNKRGLRDGNFACYCSPERELRKFSGTVTDSNGKVLEKIKRSDLIRTEYSTNFITDDYRFVYGIDEPLNYPIFVTYDWEVGYKEVLASYPDFYPIDGLEVAVDTASFRFIQGPGNTMEYRVFNFEPNIKVTENDGKGRRVTEFSVGHMKHLESQAFGVPFIERAPMVILAPKQFDWKKTHCDLTDWKSFGQWIWTLNQGRDVLPPAIKEKLHQATDTCTSDRSKVAVVRKMLGEMTRYVSIQLGIGGYQTAPAEEVCTRGIGDCKALSNCFCAMIHEIGLPAFYTVINTNRRHIYRDLPFPGQFNHAIAQVPLPGDTLWIECTNDIYPIEYRHEDLCGHEVVVITPEGGQICTIPEYPDTLNSNHFTIDITLSPDGSAQMLYNETSLNNKYEEMCGMQRISSKDQRKRMLSRFDSKNLTIDTLNFSFDGPRFDCQMQLNGAAFAKWSNNRIFLPTTINAFGALRNTKEEAHPIDLTESGHLSVEEMIYHIPEGYEVESKLDGVKIETPFGSLTKDYEQKDGCIVIRETYLLKSALYPAEQFNDWVAFRKALADSSKKKLVLKKIQ